MAKRGMLAWEEIDAMSAQQLKDFVQKRCKRNKRLEAELCKAWEITVEHIDEHANKAAPKLKSFEVHHLREKAREAFFRHYCKFGSLTDAPDRALLAIGLETPL